jgi:hypothetical protein
MNIIYECEICHKFFISKEKCEECEKSHIHDTLCRRIELGRFIGSTKYGFYETSFRNADGTVRSDVTCFGLYDGHPKFSIECYDTPKDVLDAKGRLIQAAIDWMNDYKDTIQLMLDELKKEQEK